MFPVIKLQQLHTELLGFSQCKVVQAELPNPSAILQNHSTAEHSPMNTLSSLERAIQHWPWLPEKLLIQQLFYGTRQSSSPRQEVALSHLHFFLLFHWGIHSEGKNQIIQQPMNQHSMAQQEHWSCNFNCQELHVGLELPLWTPTKGHCQLILSQSILSLRYFQRLKLNSCFFYFENKNPSKWHWFFSSASPRTTIHSFLLHPVIKPVISEVLLFFHGFIEVVTEQRQGTVIGSHLCIDLDELFFLHTPEELFQGKKRIFYPNYKHQNGKTKYSIKHGT